MRHDLLYTLTLLWLLCEELTARGEGQRQEEQLESVILNQVRNDGGNRLGW